MVIVFLMGIVLGASTIFWWDKTRIRQRRRIPKEWPLTLRPLVNSGERRVWVWLSKVMFDHQLLVKLPITRFTLPTASEDATHWYPLLNGVYCTFTVCTMEGRVLACVDVQKPQGNTMSNQALKNAVLSQCGIRYWVVDPSHLPQITQIRTALLGDQALKGSDREHLENRFKDVRENLQAAVTRQRKHKNSPVGRPESQVLTAGEGAIESRLPSGWEQNSFVTPLDSRAAALEN